MMDACSFDNAKMLQMLWALPALWALYMWGFARKRQAMRRFATSNMHNALVPSVSPRRQQVKAVLTVAAAGMLVIAMAGPRWGAHYEVVPLRGVDMILVLDVSNSMLAEDVVPNRLRRAKLDIKEMLENLAGDRVGLVTFAGTSTVTCPLTVNYGSFRLALDAVDARSTPRGGTNIGDAVRRAADSFPDKVIDHKAIILISDGGETDESYAVEASRKVFEEKGIRVFTVGLGDAIAGARIPITLHGQSTYRRHQGRVIRTRLDPILLRSIAAAADGAYFPNPDFRRVSDTVRSKVTPREFRSARREMQHVRFHWFAGLALALLIIEAIMTDRKAVTT